MPSVPSRMKSALRVGAGPRDPRALVHAICYDSPSAPPAFSRSDFENDQDDVVVVLDGDDWLAGPHVLAMVAAAYCETGAWITYGTYVEYPTGLSPDWILDFPADVVERKSFRTHAFMSSHLRTFKRFLLESIAQEEFCYDDDRGWGPACASGARFFDRAGADVAVMLPLLERAGDRIVRIPHVLHVYNIATPLNDYKVHLQEQWDVDAIVRARSSLHRLPGARRAPPSHANVRITAPMPGQTVETAQVQIAFVVTGVWMPEEVGAWGGCLGWVLAAGRKKKRTACDFARDARPERVQSRQKCRVGG